MSDNKKQILFDKTIFRHIKNLCPSGRNGIDSVEISTVINGKKESVKLTKETRKKINKILKGI